MLHRNAVRGTAIEIYFIAQIIETPIYHRMSHLHELAALWKFVYMQLPSSHNGR